MNKSLFGWVLTASALFGVGFTSCQSDDDTLINNNTPEGKLIQVSLTAVIDNDDTRATLTPDGSILKFAWEKDDKLEAVDAKTGKWLGTLKVTAVNESNPKSCNFDGQITDPGTGAEINYYYMGKSTTNVVGGSYGNQYASQPLTIDFSNQNGTSASFADNDILIGKKSYPNGVKGQLGSVNFLRHFAYGQFILKVDGQELDITDVPVTISANTGKMYNKSVLNFQTGKYAPEEGSIVVTPSARNFFVNFVPSDAVNMKFTCTVNGMNFEGTKGELIKEATYYSSKGEPIVVEMVNTSLENYTLTYHSNFGDDQTKSVENKSATGSASFNVLTYAATELPEYTGYTFLGWAPTQTATEATVNPGDTFSFTELSANLYAVWEKTAYNYTISFDKQEGVTGNAPENKTVNSADDTVTVTPLPSTTDLKKEGYEFTGTWSTDPDATEGFTEYTFTRDPNEGDQSVILYPVWKKKATVTTGGYDHGEWK